MCGIAGFVSSELQNGTSMINVLTHRGPDSVGEYKAEISGKYVFLGHARLSIIDLSAAGAQPMSTSDGKVHIVYNGEVYNFQALREKYLDGYVFRSKTDTEVILYLYHRFGIDFVHKLEGDFAISILDELRKKLYLIRDRVGVKPLYYFRNDWTLIFASEIKAILKSNLRFSISEDSLHAYFVFKYVPGSETMFSEIKRLAPGHILEYSIDSMQASVRPYWKLEKNSDYEKLSYVEGKGVLLDLLRNATEMRLISDVPVGTFFSGGLDSSAIAYFIKDQSAITHYSARKNKTDLRKEGTSSDFFYSEKLARDFSLNLSPIDIGSDEANLELIRKTLFYSDDLIADASQIPSYLITRECAASSKVMLSGMGADEIFFGYAGHLLTLLSQNFDKLPGFLSRFVASRCRSLDQGNGCLKAYRRYLHKFGKYYDYPGYKYGLFSIVGDYENSMSAFKDGENSSAAFLSGYFKNGDDPFDSLMRFDVENMLVKNLHYTDRMSMANSVESRVPFLDHRIVEFAYTIPRAWKLSDTGVAKKILKDTLKPYLPSYILKRRKAGFGMPLRSIFSSQDKVSSLLDFEFFGSFDSFSVPNIKRMISSHQQGREDNSSIIYALISYQEWHKLFMNGRF
ncbi:MAG: asparagine synthase (glutamine-hydrolyzing) [Calditrichaeota bacterium]|nr:asparagine synthase (glutamine-hydrolyzing) [Calditrichota bacterium]